MLWPWQLHSQLTTVVPFIKKCVFPEPMFCDGNSVGTSMTYKCCMWDHHILFHTCMCQVLCRFHVGNFLNTRGYSDRRHCSWCSLCNSLLRAASLPGTDNTNSTAFKQFHKQLLNQHLWIYKWNKPNHHSHLPPRARARTRTHTQTRARAHTEREGGEGGQKLPLCFLGCVTAENITMLDISPAWI
jgi:hypothetical protein